jgi:glyoxylase I family protein
MKPHPDSVLHALDILDLPRAQRVLIGDSVTDIEVSRATGLRSIGYAKTPPAATNYTSPVPMPSPTQTMRWPSTSATARQRARRPWRYPAAMPVKLDNVGIAVRDLDAATAFFSDLGLSVLGSARISGEWADIAVGLDGNTADIAILQTPDGNGRIEMFQYVHPDAIEVEPVQPNTIGMHRVCLTVDNIDAALEIAARHGCHPLRGVATYEDVYKLTYLRGPSGILVMFAEELKKED